MTKVRSYCAQENLLPSMCAGAHIIAAVSGGADSMALLRVLLTLRAEYGFALSACHVNHGLRGVRADADEAFVRGECARFDVPLRVFRAEERGEQIPPHAGEDWARRLRYACFAQAVQETGGQGITRLATAHTATDQAETLLLRLARGTGLHGAAGIRPQRDVYIRPLLCLTRAQTEAYCVALGQPWVTDETNNTDAYARNRVRHAALPALRTVNTAAEKNLARFCSKAARADAYFAREGKSLLVSARFSDTQPQAVPASARYALADGQPVWHLEPLRHADELVLEAALHSLVEPVRDAEEKYIALLALLVRRGTGAVQLTADVRFCADEGVLWCEKAAPQTGRAEPLVQPFCPQTQAEYSLPGGHKLKTRLLEQPFEEKTQRVHKKDLKNEADYAKIVSLYPAPVLRTRQPGDRYAPAGRGISKQLRKWMNEAGIPPQQRDTLPLLASGSKVLWVCGTGFAEEFAPTQATTQVLQIWEEVDNEHAR